MARTPVELKGDKVNLGKLKPDKMADRKAYQEKLVTFQKKMLRVQQAYFHEGRRAVIVFEGWDASGKGGAIRRLTEKLDPRGVAVHAIGAPSADEQGRHYLYRFWNRIPRPGSIAIFDRSWYGRVLVERVEGFAEVPAWSRAYEEINDFEHMLIDDGVRVVKVFLHISKKEQAKRFAERLKNPDKRWKLTEEDLRNRERWDEYTEAIEAMLLKTSTEAAPWRVVPSNHKWYARTAVLELVTNALAAGVDTSSPMVSPELLAAAAESLGVEIKL